MGISIVSDFTTVVHEKIHLETEINSQYICLKNITAKFVCIFISGRADLCWIFSEGWL